MEHNSDFALMSLEELQLRKGKRDVVWSLKMIHNYKVNSLALSQTLCTLLGNRPAAQRTVTVFEVKLCLVFVFLLFRTQLTLSWFSKGPFELMKLR